VILAAEEFDSGNGRRCAAAHAVVKCDHLRHVGHGNSLAADPGKDAADGDRDRHQTVILHARIEKGDQRRHDHAGAGPQDAAAGSDRRTHTFQAEDEKNRSNEVTEFDQNPQGRTVAHLRVSLLLLNISSMRSVTT
jgi:hypothetical protein